MAVSFLLSPEQEQLTLAARQFAGLLKAKGLRKIHRGDILIASISLARNATLVTRNTRDFSLVPGLKFVNWAG